MLVTKAGRKTAIQRAVAVLAKYGGSLYVADPRYSFLNDNGTGETADGAPVGYVRDLVGNARPLTQATAGARPLLRRVPKLLGQELVTNGDFADTSSWFAGTNWTISSGVATHSAAAISTLTQVLSTVAGKQYAVSFQIADMTTAGAGLSARLGTGGAGSVLGGIYSAVGTYTDVLTPTADQTALQLITRGASGDWVGSADNISVREVLEWGWAWVGDGTDDTLATVAQPTTNTAETMGVAYWHTGVNNKAGAIHYLNRRNAGLHLGEALFQGAGSNLLSAIAGYSSASTTQTMAPSTNAANVTSLQADGSTMRRFLNGAQVGADVANPYSFATSAPIYLLSSQGATNSFCDRPVFAAYHVPAMLTDSERRIVERAMAQFAGVTI